MHNTHERGASQLRWRSRVPCPRPRSTLAGRRLAVCLVLLALLLPLTAAGLTPVRTQAAPATGLPKPAVLNRYDLDVTYDPSARTIGGALRLAFTNNTRDTLTDLWFHLYP